MKNTYLSLIVLIIILFCETNAVAQCPDNFVNQSSSIVLSPGKFRTGLDSVTGELVDSTCGLRMENNDTGEAWSRYDISIMVADNGLQAGDEVQISFDIRVDTGKALFQIVKDGYNKQSITSQGFEVSSTFSTYNNVIEVPTDATSLVMWFFTNHSLWDSTGSIIVSNLRIVKVGEGNNDQDAPTVPANITASNVTTNSANLSWSPSTDNIGVTGYKLFQDGSEIQSNLNSTSYQVTGLTENTTYQFTVKALDAAGNESASSNSISVTTSSSADTQSPIAPTLVENGKTDTTVNLSWSGATDNIEITGYKVYTGGSLTATLGNVASYQVTGLTENTTYQFTVKALDAAGNESARSNTLNITTDAASSNEDSTNDDSTGDNTSGGGGSTTSVWSEDNATASYTGNVAIGTNSVPSGYKLAVEGKIRTREVRVDQDNWPDYVFDKDYNLPSLEEIQKHIKEKGHLINIPSAKEVAKNGVELGEMNKLLLEKIEELTLYILKQEERISQLERKTSKEVKED